MLISYLLQRQREAADIRLILTGKINGFRPPKPCGKGCVSCMADVRMGAVGERDAVLCFKALGMTVHPHPNAGGKQPKHCFSLTKRGVRLIFITESTAESAQEAIRRYQTDPQVAIIPIPGSTGSSGYAMSRVRANVEKAIGADILFGNNTTEDV